MSIKDYPLYVNLIRKDSAKWCHGNTSKNLNLLLPLDDIEEPDEVVRDLFARFSDGEGVLAFYHKEDACVVAERTSKFEAMRIYRYDGEAPYVGLYLYNQFVHVLGG